MDTFNLRSYLTDQDWQKLLEKEFSETYFLKLEEFLQKEHQQGKTIYPPFSKIFTAFNQLSPQNVRVVILGQDPYHQEGQANGMSFSVPSEVKIPPSLRNIFREVQDCGGQGDYTSGDLTPWLKQGVFLLNTVLTVQASKANSHQKKGWEKFTDQVIRSLSNHSKSLIFLLWGSPAQKKINLINQEKHQVLTSVHPSPLSAYRGFLGCAHFSQVNEIFQSRRENLIDW